MAGLLAAPAITQSGPLLVAYQARLTDAGGAPLGGAQTVTASVYSAPAGGSPLYSETHATTVVNGVASLLLGSVDPMPSNLFDGAERYVGITVAPDLEMAPRLRFAAVPYAVLARDVSGADIHPNGVTVNGMLVIDASGTWVELAHYSGGGAPMSGFEHVSGPLPPGAIHAGFRVRFRSVSDETDSADDWFVDDVCIGSLADCPEPPPPPTPCADADGDGVAGINDLLILLAQWGSSPGGPPDFDGGGTVGIEDLLILLGEWGLCG